MKKQRIIILFGGKSYEHDISVLSTGYVYEQIKNYFDVKLVYIDKAGGYHVLESVDQVKTCSDAGKGLNLLPEAISDSDYVVSLVHGAQGEDGQIQGFLNFIGKRNLGSNIESTVLCYNKKLTKLIAEKCNIPVIKSVFSSIEDRENANYEYLSNILGSTFIVKPNRSGSSFGFGLINCAEVFDKNVNDAIFYDKDILFEEFVDCRELSCVVLGGGSNYVITNVGEDDPCGDLNTYDVKYFSTKSKLYIPAKISDTHANKIKEYSIIMMNQIGISGLVRYDFFLVGDQIYLNEINTCPGMTSHSLAPLLLKDVGFEVADSVNFLLENYE